jgi:hypothetical protein
MEAYGAPWRPLEYKFKMAIIAITVTTVTNN